METDNLSKCGNMSTRFSEEILKLLKKLNSVTLAGAQKRLCKPFYVDNQQMGLIRPDCWEHLSKYPWVFELVDSQQADRKQGVHLGAQFQTYRERTLAINQVLEDLRKKDVVDSLRGWRHENYKISQGFNVEPVLEMERAATGLFGALQYGVHVNGYVRSSTGGTDMWIARRSKTKQTFPDMFDNMCAGGLAADLGVMECVLKECQEEASVSLEILENLKFVGTVSYFYEDERGLSPECQFVFDLELPADFLPVNSDGEVASFQKCSIDELKELMIGGHFKPNCAAVCLDFLIRHGYINPDTDPNTLLYVEQLHAPLQTYYSG